MEKKTFDDDKFVQLGMLEKNEYGVKIHVTVLKRFYQAPSFHFMWRNSHEIPAIAS